MVNCWGVTGGLGKGKEKLTLLCTESLVFLAAPTIVKLYANRHSSKLCFRQYSFSWLWGIKTEEQEELFGISFISDFSTGKKRDILVGPNLRRNFKT